MIKISDFFQGKVVLITGATGFVGQPLVAKILTNIPTVQKIYLIIRDGVGSNGAIKTAQERLETEFFNSSVFTQLRQTHGNDFKNWIGQKVFAVSGNLSQERLGVSEDWYAKLVKEVQIFINSAAIVQFDAPIDDATWINVISVRHAVQFAHQCENAIFVHISTAYSCGNRSGLIPEDLHPPYEDLAKELSGKEYPVPKTFEAEVEGMIEIGQQIREKIAQTDDSSQHFGVNTEKSAKKWLENQLVEAGRNHALMRGWHDIYTYTKALGEEVVSRMRGDLPVAIIRPSIIESSLEEPSPGWLAGLRMADPIIIGFGKGRLPDFPATPNITLDIIPVDIVVNATLAAAARSYENGGIEVYHITSGYTNPLSFQRLHDLTMEYFREFPMVDKGNPISVSAWKFPSKEKFSREFEGKLRYLSMLSWILKKIPTKWASKKNRRIAVLQNAIERLLYYADIYGPYANLNFDFEARKVNELHQSLSPEEQYAYHFDPSRIDWKHYLQQIHIPGIKHHILKMEDELDHLETNDTKNRYPDELTEDPSFQNIPSLLKWRADKLPHKVALQIKRAEGWVRYTYSDFYDLSRRIAGSLWERGLRKGDRVILFSENQPEWGIAYFAASQLGLVLVPIDQQTSSREVYALADFTSAKVILTTKKLFDRLGKFVDKPTENPPQCLNVNNFCQVFGTAQLAHFDLPEPSDELFEAKIEPSGIASIIFTSGTPSDPKGAMLSHGNFISNVLAVATVLEPYETDQMLSVLPMYHALEFTSGFLMSIYGGTTVTYLDSPTTMLEIMYETQTTVMVAVPRFFQMLYKTIMRHLTKSTNLVISDTSSDSPFSTEIIQKAYQAMGGKIRVFVSGGASLPDTVYDNFNRLGITIHQGYGLTESSPVLAVTPYNKSRRSSVGLAVEGTKVEIKDANSDGIGEIVAKGPGVMRGYYNNPEATKKAIINNYLYTGDLGRFDDDGYLYVTGRSKEVIVTSAGKNVYPIEIEALYRQNEIIDELCVVGISPTDEISEDVHAVIVPKENAELAQEEVEQIIFEHIKKTREELPSYQQIQKSHFLWDDHLQKKENGEIDRRQVKTWLEKYIAAIKSSELLKNPVETSLEDWEDWEDWEKEIILELSHMSNVPTDQIRSETDIDTDLALDSIMKVELLLLLENEVHKHIPDEIISEIQTVDDIFDAVKQIRSTTFQTDVASDIHPVLINQRSLALKICSQLFRACTHILCHSYFSIRSYGIEHIPKGQPYIVAANHSSHLDTVAIMTALGSESRKLQVAGAKEYFFDSKIKSWFFSNFMNVVPFDRETISLQSLNMSKEILNGDMCLLIYPEGTRSIDGKLQSFKAGLGVLALRTGVPIIPSYIEGTYQAWAKGEKKLSKSKIRVIFGEPIFCQPERDLSNRNKYQKYQEIVADTRSKIKSLKAAIEAKE